MIDAASTMRTSAPPMQGVSQVGALRDFLEDIDRIFVRPRPMASPAVRAQRVVEGIDWSQPLIILWVPGTSDHEVTPPVAAQLRAAGAPAAYLIDYDATWQLRTSVPDGEATLREVLRLAVRRKRPGQRIVLLGESQGAWIISSVLRDPALAAVVDRAALLAHPAMAPAHVHPSTSSAAHLDPSHVREFNGEHDVVSRELGRSAARALDVVDSFANLRIGHALLGTLTLAITSPALLGALIGSQLFRVEGVANPHATTDRLAQAVAWVLGSAP